MGVWWDDLPALSDADLIKYHAERWRAWHRARAQYGDLASSPHMAAVSDLELEARRRGMPDDVLMAPIRDAKENLRQ